MTLTYGFYDSISSDRLYNAQQMGEIFDGIILDGVYAGLGDKLMVAEDALMNVTVGTGRAWLNHTWTYNDSDLTKAIATADALLDRIDVVYLEVNEGVGTRANSIAVLTGTPASTPVAPTLTQTAEVHQYPLAHIYVAKGVTAIIQDNITNKVGMVNTPFVAGIIDYVTTNELLVQWEAQWLTWFDAIKDQLSTEAETNLQAQIWAIVGDINPPLIDLIILEGHDHDGTDTVQITSSGLASGAVTGGKIATGGVSVASQLASNVVETAKIKDLNVTSGKLAANSVIAGKIADGAVDVTASLANNIVDDTKVGNRVPQFYRRQGGAATDWISPGTTNYTPTAVRQQAGVVLLGGGITSVPITFPVAFSYKPIIVATRDSSHFCYPAIITPSGFTMAGDDSTGAENCTWLAIGPE